MSKQKTLAGSKGKQPGKRKQGGKGKPFTKGVSGNPAGTSSKTRKVRKAIEQQIRDAIEIDGRNVAIDGLVEIARDGNHKDRTSAYKLLLAYGYGNPSTRVFVSPEAPDGDSVPLKLKLV